MAGLHVAPDKKTAFTVVTNGSLSNKRCEFWKFDLASLKLTDKEEFKCRSRYTLGMSADDVYQAYLKKNAVNHQRQESGYVKKDEADSKHI